MIKNYMKKDTIELLSIKDIQNDCIICDTHLVAIIEVSGANLFQYKEEEARWSILWFMHWVIDELDIPVQLITQSRPKNFNNHISEIKNKLKKNDYKLRFEKNLERFMLYYQAELKRGEITKEDIIRKFNDAPDFIEKSMLDSYVERLDTMIKNNNLLEKRYYVVVSTLDKSDSIKEKDEGVYPYINFTNSTTFNEYKKKLDERVRYAQDLLNEKSGLGTRILKNDELINIMFDCYNFPISSVHQMNSMITDYWDLPPVLEKTRVTESILNWDKNESTIINLWENAINLWLDFIFDEKTKNSINIHWRKEKKRVIPESNPILQLIKPFAIDNSNMNYLKINNTYTFTYHINRFWDEYLEDLMLWPILTLPYHYDLSVHLFPINKEGLLLEFKKSKLRIENDYKERFKNAKSEAQRQKETDAAQIKLNNLTDIENDIKNKQTNIYTSSIDVTFRASSIEEMEEIKEKVNSLFSTKKIFVSETTGDHLAWFVSTLPILKNEVSGYKKMFKRFPESSQIVSHYYPFCPGSYDSMRGLAFWLWSQWEGKEKTQRIVMLDYFDREKVINSIMIVIWNSWSWKSTMAQWLFRTQELLGYRHLIVDFLGNYYKWAEDMPDRYQVIKIDPQSKDKINPCDLTIPNNDFLDKNPDYAGLDDEKIKENLIRQKVADLWAYFKMFFKDEYDGVTKWALNLITIDIYKKRLKDVNIRKEKYIWDIMLTDIVDALKKEKDVDKKAKFKEIADILSQYASWSYSGMFNSQTNVKIDNRSIVFYLRGNKDGSDEQTLAILQSFILVNEVVNRTRGNLFCIDELAKLFEINDESIISFVNGQIATIRNLQWWVVWMTQLWDQLFAIDAGRKFYEMSEIRLILAWTMKKNDNPYNIINYEKWLSNISKSFIFQHAGDKWYGILILGREQIQVKIENHADLALYDRYAAPALNT